jgi:hypothetical protein
MNCIPNLLHKKLRATTLAREDISFAKMAGAAKALRSKTASCNMARPEAKIS